MCNQCSLVLVQEQRNKDRLQPETWCGNRPNKAGAAGSQRLGSETLKRATTYKIRAETARVFSPAPRVSGLQAIRVLFLFLCSVLNHIFKRHFLKGKDWEKILKLLSTPV